MERPMVRSHLWRTYAEEVAMLIVYTVAISLILHAYHALEIACACRMKVHVIITSYISPAMQELESKINEARICVMNEISVFSNPSLPQCVR